MFDSQLLEAVLIIALKIGNFLNAASNQGLAIGFTLETLPRLKDTKAAKDKSVTMMHVIARWDVQHVGVEGGYVTRGPPIPGSPTFVDGWCLVLPCRCSGMNY